MNPSDFERCRKIAFVPNQDDTRSNADLIKFEAERHNQDPETVIVIPFSELEGSLTTVDTHILAEGHPVPMEVFDGFGTSCVIEQENPSKLGEQLADELETFDPLHPTEIANSTTTFTICYDNDPLVTVISSDEDITKLEQQATGHDIDG